MTATKPLFYPFLILFFCIVSFSTAYSNPVRAPHIEVELIAEVTQVKAGQPFWVAVRFQPDEHWHTYWRNPGDSGMPPRIEWTLPAGSQAGEPQWAYPERIAAQHLVNFGYHGESLLLVEIQPAANDTATSFTLDAKVSWLVCEEICIPGDAALSLTLPFANQASIDPRWKTVFAETRAKLPMPQPAWQATYDIADDFFILHLQTDTPLLASAQRITFFPVQIELIENAADQDMMWDAQTLSLRIQKSAYFSHAPTMLDAVLVVDDHAYHFTAQQQSTSLPTNFTPHQQIASVANNTTSHNIGLVMLFALLGGMLLNLMPCVFPVLSLKALSMMEAAKKEHHAQQGHGLAYTLGVVLSFVAVASLLLVLRAAGESIGWGFQLQSPLFIAVLSYLFFAMALSLSGVVNFGTSMMGMGDNLTQKSGYVGSFFTGVLAAVVASPCTAPFMGTAIGVAVQQPTLLALAIFASLGFGMALPFLLLAFMPQLANYLPKPGIWMETFKQFMAFPLYATVIWLLWVLGRQTSVSGLVIILSGLLLLAFALWLWGQPAHGRWRWFNVSIASLSFVVTLGLLGSPLLNTSNTTTATPAEATWEAYTPQRLAELRQQQQPVFINMTADWCITCLVNEQTTLNTTQVRQAFNDRGITYLKGDWTNRNPDITTILAQFGRNGVPLYVYYPTQGEPVVLPQILTVDTVLQALR